MCDCSLHAVVQEAAAMECQILVAISAPMALAVRAAESYGITPVAVAHGDRRSRFSATRMGLPVDRRFRATNFSTGLRGLRRPTPSRKYDAEKISRISKLACLLHGTGSLGAMRQSAGLLQCGQSFSLQIVIRPAKGFRFCHRTTQTETIDHRIRRSRRGDSILCLAPSRAVVNIR